MSVEQRDPAVCDGSNNMGGKGEMTKAPDILQDLRRNLYVEAKAEPSWRFWGLYVHVCKTETIYEAKLRTPVKADAHPKGVKREQCRPGQESVWDYPRPPLLERSPKTVLV